MSNPWIYYKGSNPVIVNQWIGCLQTHFVPQDHHQFAPKKSPRYSSNTWIELMQISTQQTVTIIPTANSLPIYLLYPIPNHSTSQCILSLKGFHCWVLCAKYLLSNNMCKLAAIPSMGSSFSAFCIELRRQNFVMVYDSDVLQAWNHRWGLPLMWMLQHNYINNGIS